MRSRRCRRTRMTLPDKQCSAYFPRLKTGQRVPDGLLTLSSTVGVNPGIFTLTECAIAEIRGKVVASSPSPLLVEANSNTRVDGRQIAGHWPGASWWLAPSLPTSLVGWGIDDPRLAEQHRS